MKKRQLKAYHANKKQPVISSQYAPKQKGESTIHYQARVGLILTPHNWVWSKKKGLLIDKKTNQPIERLYKQ